MAEEDEDAMEAAVLAVRMGTPPPWRLGVGIGDGEGDGVRRGVSA